MTTRTIHGFGLFLLDSAGQRISIPMTKGGYRSALIDGIDNIDSARDAKKNLLESGISTEIVCFEEDDENWYEEICR